MACYNEYDILGCGSGCGCTQTFTVHGCNALALVGATVSVYASMGGALLTSGTTNGSGQVALTWAGGCAVYVTVTGTVTARFTAYAQSLTLTTGGSTTLALSPTASYQCVPLCVQPLATTIFVTYAGHLYTLIYGSYLWGFPGSPTQFGFTGWANPQSAWVTLPASVCSLGFGCVCISGSTPSNIFAVIDGTTSLSFGLVGYFCCICTGCATPVLANVSAGPDLVGVAPASGVAVTCPTSFAASGTFPGSFAAGLGGVACSSGGTVAVPTPGGGGTFTASE